MAVYFEEGTLPSGEKADLCVVELSAGNVGKFPADAVSQDGKTTYRELYAEAHDRFKKGEQVRPDEEHPEANGTNPAEPVIDPQPVAPPTPVDPIPVEPQPVPPKEPAV